MTGTIERHAYRDVLPSGGQAGVIAPSDMGIGGRAAAAPTASRTYALLVRPARDLLVSQIGLAIVTAAGSNDNLDVGILDAQGNKIISSGATAGKLNVVGPVISLVSITPTLLRGGVSYYAACAFGTFGGSAVSVWNATFSGAAGDAFGTEPGRRIAAQQASSTTIPSTMTMAVSVQAPLLILR